IQELLLRIPNHLREAAVNLFEFFVTDGHDRHADRGIIEELAGPLIAGLESRGSVGDETHFADASKTRDNEKNIFKYHPTSVFHGTPWTRNENTVNRIRQIDDAQKMIEGHHDCRRYQHSPISVERENDQRPKDVEMRLDPAACQCDKQRGH